MASSRRKQDEKNLKTLRELGSQPANRTCFDCHQRGTTYINMTVGSFVCTSCSGILRGLNPPHRVKSISMATFTQEEIDQIKSKGNQYCGAVWLGLYDAKLSPFPDTKDENKIREFMITKYEKKRFYVDPSIALKNMPPQTPSGTSSTASTPNSDTPKPGPPAPSASVSRPSVPPSQCTKGRWQERKPVLPPLKLVRLEGSQNFSVSAGQSSGSVSGGLAGSKSSTPKSSVSLDLLSDLASPPVDPFASPAPHSATNAIPSFANFENANIFTNTTGTTTASNKSTPSGPHLPFSSNPLTPMTPNSSHTPSSTSVTPATTSATPATNQQPKQDRYAALKDLDEEFKTQKESETISNGGVSWPIPNGSQHVGSTTGVFGAPGTMNGTPGAFGSPSNGVFGTMNGAGGGNGGVMGTPPTTNNAWANFTRANPFSGCSNGGNAWMNGGTNMAGGSTQHHQGFGSVVPHNPFGASADPNFNQFGGGNAVAALNGSSPAPGGGSGGSGGGGGWANFPQNNKMQWMAANGAANGAANPFMQTAPQMPSSGSSYNPFL